MKTEVGVWIDHKRAVIATIAGESEELTQVLSNLEPRDPGAAREDVPENQKDRRFTEHLNKYYDEVVACIRQADSILILGPGEAKGELEARLNKENLGERIVGIETSDKLTDRQIATRAREHFRRSAGESAA